MTIESARGVLQQVLRRRRQLRRQLVFYSILRKSCLAVQMACSFASTSIAAISESTIVLIVLSAVMALITILDHVLEPAKNAESKQQLWAEIDSVSLALTRAIADGDEDGADRCALQAAVVMRAVSADAEMGYSSGDASPARVVAAGSADV